MENILKHNKYNEYIIQDCLKSCSYNIDTSRFRLNIIGIRNLNLRTKDKFIDRICLIINVYDSIKYFEFPSTTKASVDGILSSKRYGCDFILEPGMYRNIWKLGYDNKFIQHYPIYAIHCIHSKRKTLNYDEFELNTFATVHGIELKPLKFITSVKKVSEGVSQYVEKDSNMNIILSYAIMQKNALDDRLFSYILIDEENGILIPTNKIYGE